MPADDDGRPSFAEVVKAMTPPGTNWDEWKTALRQAHQDGGYRPGQVAPDISLPAGGPLASAIRDFGQSANVGLCPACHRVHDLLLSCEAATAPNVTRKALGLPPPADPFSEADPASIALAEMYHSMIRAGIPVASVEGILGRMLAEHGRDDPEPPHE